QTFTVSRIMRSAAVLGSPRLTSALAIITGMAMRLWTKSWRPFWILAFLYAGSLILELTLKLAIVRGQSLSGMVAARHSSFPSGHSLRATTIYCAVAKYCGELRRDWHRQLWIIAILLSVVTGISVVYLGWHWSTDVIGGWALGAALLIIATR